MDTACPVASGRRDHPSTPSPRSTSARTTSTCRRGSTTSPPTSIRPAAAEWDEKEEFPWPVVEEAAKAGLYSIDFIVAQAFDETGLGFPITMEELFWGDAGIGLSIVGTSLAAAGVRANGTDEQVAEWVPEMFGSPGDLKLGAFCSSEPDAGSDVGAMRTRATYDEATDEWVLNGTKTWATNGGIADVHVVTAVVDPELRTRGQASFVVPPGTKGLSQGQKFHKHGIRASHTAEVVLDQVRVPGPLPARRQGEARRPAGQGPRGRRRRAATRRWRPSSAPARPSAPRRSASRARRTRWRWTTRRPASSSASRSSRTRRIAFMLADMAISIEASRLLVWRAAWMARQGKRFEKAEGSMSKLFAGETAVKVTERAMQILGGNGFTREYPVERMARDAKIYTIFEGTSEIQRLVIARSISGAPIR